MRLLGDRAIGLLGDEAMRLVDEEVYEPIAILLPPPKEWNSALLVMWENKPPPDTEGDEAIGRLGDKAPKKSTDFPGPPLATRLLGEEA